MRSISLIALAAVVAACGARARTETPTPRVHPNVAMVRAYEQLADAVRPTAGNCDAFADTMYAWIEHDGPRVLELVAQAEVAERQSLSERRRLSERLRDALVTVSHVGYLCQDARDGLGAWRNFESLVRMQLTRSGPEHIASIAAR